MAKFAIATMLVIFLSLSCFLSSSAFILLADGLNRHKIKNLSDEERYRLMLLQSCKGEKDCIERGLSLSSLRKKQPPSPPAPIPNSKKIHVIVHVPDPPLLSLWKRVKASVYESAPPSPPSHN
ncbi:hypothetical protein TIFTF001_010763 [Ficus carica]|uniref:Uncharacterized protein n=1 Tax=Ficus carica TaxID=3494 RepID=A0AA87ZX10_FICCA|nr:hypothetical protein TIFTF001_010763 [Ficus carica]